MISPTPPSYRLAPCRVRPLRSGLTLAVLLLASAAGAYDEVKIEDGGGISGIVRLAGAPPPLPRREVTRDGEVCGAEPKTSDALVVAAAQGIRNVVVYLEGIRRGKAFASAPVELDQRSCWFVPHVVLVRAAQPFTLVNSDSVLHNFRTPGTGANPALNKAQPKFKKRLPIQIDQPDIIPVNCDVHEWMHAVVVVMGHPYYALTDDNGHFALTDVPPGRYALVFWHEVLGKQVREVAVMSGSDAKVTAEFKGK